MTGPREQRRNHEQCSQWLY